jgi:hypothetical protein
MHMKRNEICWLRRIAFHVVTKNDGVGMDLVAKANGLARLAQRDAAAKKEARNAARRKNTGNHYNTGMTASQMIKAMAGR